LPVVRKLQADAIDQDASVTSLLRTAKVIATKLELKDALMWIDRELDGYMDLTSEELPPYRRLTGDLRGYNPYHGWQPVIFPDPEIARLFSQAPMGISIGSLEEDLRGRRDRGGDFIFGFRPEVKTEIMNALEYPADVQLQLSYGALFNIVDAVRNLVLNWSLELEKAGIHGDDMEFSQDDKKEAAPITQQFFAQNIGVVGNVTDKAHVANKQSATMTLDINLNAVRDFVTQVQQALSSLPEDTRDQLAPTITDLQTELSKDAPSHSRLRDLLGSVRSISEGAAGNLSAQGILGLLQGLF